MKIHDKRSSISHRCGHRSKNSDGRFFHASAPVQYDESCSDEKKNEKCGVVLRVKFWKDFGHVKGHALSVF